MARRRNPVEESRPVRYREPWQIEQAAQFAELVEAANREARSGEAGNG